MIKRYLPSLTGRMVTGILLVNLVLVPTLFYGVLRVITNEYKEQFVNYARAQTYTLSTLAAKDSRPQRLQELLNDLLLSGQNAYADLVMANGSVIKADTDIGLPTLAFREDFVFSQHRDHTYFVSLPVFSPSKTDSIGSLRLGFDEAPVEERITLTFRNGIYLASGYVALSLIIMGFLGSHLTRSIRQLGAASRRIATGQIEEALAVNSNVTEIAHLCNDLEHMRKELLSRGQEIARRAAHQQAILENAGEAIVSLDEKGRIISLNRAAESMFGRSESDCVGIPFSTLLDTQDILRFMSLEDGIHLGTGQEFKGLRSNGEVFYILMSTTTYLENDHRRYILIIQDISERRAFENQLEYLANHDTLTGLPNRALFRERLTHAMNNAYRNEKLVALMFLDLDRFKTINDTLGHDIGDQLLKGVSERLQSCLRQCDTVARLGGDEFTVILEDIPRVKDAGVVAQKIVDALAKPFHINGHEVFSSSSVGVTIYPFDDDNLERLIKNADTAMYRAKEQGRNNFQFYTVDLNSRSFERLALENSLHHALNRDEFVLHYQPQIEIGSGRIIGVEALIRWQHPDMGLISPAQFIPLLEDTGLIIPVGEWVLRTACEQNKRFQDMGLSPLRMAVNFSARQFRQKDLVAMVANTLKDTGMDPQHLEIEITEGLLMEDVGATVQILNGLSQMGAHLSIDDFGTGYSSLSYLKRFPINALKIDRSFVRDIDSDAGDAAIVTAVIAMAHQLNIKVIAEGVETEEQLRFLEQHGCDVLQGFYFSKPIAADALEAMLRQDSVLLPKARLLVG